MSKFIVMDIVFYAGSLNYDQGSGNYQELKKITKWDGKQYTFVSRYALRYSLLQTAKKLGWELAEGGKLKPEGQGEQKVIQPSENLIYSGEIIKYPEFDLFGYLITSTTPQNFREAPVKISHAISLTPFNYDTLFNANLWMANRLRKLYGEMKPNPFTSEEHFSYYQYSIVIDVNRIGEIELYKQVKKDDIKKINVTYDSSKNIIKLSTGEGKDKSLLTLPVDGDIFELDKVSIPIDKIENLPPKVRDKIEFNPGSEVVIWKYRLKDKKNNKEEFPKIERIETLIKAILNLRRSIKARDEDLSPKLLVLGLYENEPYKTFKDKIMLKDGYTEEEYDEIIEKEENGKIVRKVVHKVVKSKKAIFQICKPSGIELGEVGEINEENIIKDIKGFLGKTEGSNKSNGNKNRCSKICIYKTPEIEVVTS